MKIRLTFIEMQEFIRYVSDMVVQYGFGYKDFLITYCFVKYYGSKANPPIAFQNDDIQKIYDEEYEVYNGIYNIDYDGVQYQIILAAIDDEIEKALNTQNAKNVMNDFNNAVIGAINSITEYFEKQEKTFNSEQIETVTKAITSIGENVNADTLTKAMIDNGVIKGRKPRTKRK